MTKPSTFPCSSNEDVRRARHTPQQTTREILIAAEGLFAEHGFAGMSMSGLAKQLGMSAATVHKYFGSKRGLAEAVCGLELERFAGHMEAAISTEDGTAVALERFAIAVLAYNSGFASPTPKIFELYVFAAQSDWTVFRAFRERVVHLLSKVLQAGEVRGDVRVGAAECVEQVFDGFSAILHPLVVRDFRYQGGGRAPALARFLYQALQ
ncbi:TetR/AcrR family transcriptional regulator [Pseudomonas sp. App30]|uniref:TetR/AcrR family transcriptional regulator n=1 Tax=Pseudomonas sp. App30 TaxID=3068990 RepID=UPI003A80D02D